LHWVSSNAKSYADWIILEIFWGYAPRTPKISKKQKRRRREQRK
jgi:hypothetical protein